MFRFFNPNKISIVRQCRQSKLFLLHGDRSGACLGYGENEDECISNLPVNFQCTLPDGSTWRVVKGGVWSAIVSKAKPAKAVVGGESW